MKKELKDTAFVGGLLIDGTGAEPIKDSLVLVKDGKVAYAGAGKEFSPEYEIVDVSGKTIMPGLIDTHLHAAGQSLMLQNGFQRKCPHVHKEFPDPPLYTHCH